MNSISFWEKTSFYDNYDVVVIGAGIVGLNAAIQLKQQSNRLKVCVLERGVLPSGASTKNAGFTTFGSLSELIEQQKRSDTKGMVEITERRWRGLQKLIQMVGAKNLDYQQHGGHELFKKEQGELFQNCRDQIDYFNEILAPVIGSKDIFSVQDHLIKDFGFEGVEHLIKNNFEGQIDSGKMMEALLFKAHSLDVKIFTGVDVLKINKETNKIVLQSAQGISFSTKKVILCNNAFVAKLYPGLDVVPGRGQVIITKEIPNLKVVGTFHYDKGYYYFRNINNRILFGGGRNIDLKREETYNFGQTDEVLNSLKHILEEVILPHQAVEIDYSWSGIMAFGKDLEPIVEKLEENIYCAVRCNGMGVALGSLLGMEVADLLIREVV